MYWAKSKEDIIKDWDYFKTITFLKHFDKKYFENKNAFSGSFSRNNLHEKKGKEKYMENFDKRLKSERH